MAKLARRTGTSDDLTPPVKYWDGTTDISLLVQLTGIQKIGLAYRVSGSASGSGSSRYYNLFRVRTLAGEHSKVYNRVTGWRMNFPTDSSSRLQQGTSATRRANLDGTAGQEGQATWVPNRLYTTVAVPNLTEVLSVLYASTAG